MAILWTWVWEPLLFVTIGSSIEFATLDSGIIPRSLLIVCTGAPCSACCAAPAAPRCAMPGVL